MKKLKNVLINDEKNSNQNKIYKVKKSRIQILTKDFDPRKLRFVNKTK